MNDDEKRETLVAMQELFNTYSMALSACRAVLKDADATSKEEIIELFEAMVDASTVLSDGLSNALEISILTDDFEKPSAVKDFEPKHDICTVCVLPVTYTRVKVADKTIDLWVHTKTNKRRCVMDLNNSFMKKLPFSKRVATPRGGNE